MTPQEIRERQAKIEELAGVEAAGVCFWLAEIALQLAEENDVQRCTNDLLERMSGRIADISERV